MLICCRPASTKLPPALALLLVSCCSTCADAQSVGDQLVGVHANLIFARRAAEAGNIDDVRNGLEVLLHHPVFDRLQLHHVIRRVRAVQREEIDLAGGTPVRLHLRRRQRPRRRKRDLRKPLERPLAVPEILFFVVENELDVGEAEQRERPQMGHVRHAVHHDLERNRDLLLHLLGGDSRPLRDDLDVIVRHVGIRFHRKLVERNRAPPEQQKRRGQHEKAVLQREINQLANHLLLHRVLENKRVRYHLIARLDAR